MEQINRQTDNRIHWVDILRGIGILLMVYGHINYEPSVYTWIYSFHMAIFFFAAGVVYKKRPVYTDFLHRIRTILLPYYVVGILTLLYWQFAERLYKPSDVSFLDALKGLMLGRQDELVFNIPLWFLPCFFITLVLYNLLRNIPKHGRIVAFLVCLTVSVLFATKSLPPLVFGLDRVPKYIFFVALGELFAAHTPSDRFVRPTAGVLTALLGIESVILSQKLPYADTPSMWFVVATIGCGFAVELSLLISKNRILEYLGRISLIILCFHGTIYRALVYLISHISGKEMLWLRTNPIIILILTAASVLICAGGKYLYDLAKTKIFARKKVSL